MQFISISKTNHSGTRKTAAMKCNHTQTRKRQKEVPMDELQKMMQSTLFKLLAVALRVDLQWTYCCLKQSM